MSLTRVIFAAGVAAAALVACAAVPCAADPLDGPNWQLDASPKGKPTTAKSGARAGRKQAPANTQSAEEAERAARLAEGRRKFFQSKPDSDDSEKVGDFGGYNYKRDSGDGTFKPGATFKF